VERDFKDILSILNEDGVKYLIVGGYAVIKHTEPRYTKDLDIWVSRDSKNAKRLYESLHFASGSATCQETPQQTSDSVTPSFKCVDFPIAPAYPIRAFNVLTATANNAII
jgi:hypothetical protein